MSDEFGFEVKQRTSEKKPLMVIYGPSGTGKTTFGNSAGRALFIQTEDGGGELSLSTLKDGIFTSYEEVMAALRYIYGQCKDGNFDYDTLVIDSIDHLEPLVWQYVCEKGKVDSIEKYDGGYGKGYIEADKAWMKLINALLLLRDNCNMSIICLAHEIVRVVNDPMNEPYDAHELKLHKRAVALWKEKSDMIGLLKNMVVRDSKSGKGRGGTSPTLLVRPNAAYTAKTRYKAMPGMIQIPLDNGWDEVSRYIPALNT